MIPRTLQARLLLGAAFFVASAGSAGAQTSIATTAQAPSAQPDSTAGAASAQPTEPYDEEEAIVVTGQKPPGSVVGDIPPEKTLDSRDVRATGATNITELATETNRPACPVRKASIGLLWNRRGPFFMSVIQIHFLFHFVHNSGTPITQT